MWSLLFVLLAILLNGRKATDQRKQQGYCCRDITLGKHRPVGSNTEAPASCARGHRSANSALLECEADLLFAFLLFV